MGLFCRSEKTEDERAPGGSWGRGATRHSRERRGEKGPGAHEQHPIWGGNPPKGGGPPQKKVLTQVNCLYWGDAPQYCPPQKRGGGGGRGGGGRSPLGFKRKTYKNKSILKEGLCLGKKWGTPPPPKTLKKNHVKNHRVLAKTGYKFFF